MANFYLDSHFACYSLVRNSQNMSFLSVYIGPNCYSLNTGWLTYPPQK